MNDLNPPPPHAMSIWTSGDQLVLAFPPEGTEQGHHVVRIPLAKCSIETDLIGHPVARAMGWQVFLDVLRERERFTANRRTISTKAAPTNYQIERALVTKAHNPKVATKVEGLSRTDVAEAMRKVGLL